MTHPIRIAIIGCGNISRSHLDAIESLSPRTRVVLAVDPQIGRAREVAARFQCEASPSLEACLNSEVDACAVLIPHDLHYSVGKTLLSAGKHVFMEKPLANHRSECQELIEIANHSGVKLFHGYVMRYNPLCQRIHQAISKEEFGKAIAYHSFTEHHVTEERLPWLNSREKLGGGVLFSHGCHYIDLIRWFYGFPDSGIFIGSNRNNEAMEGEGTSHVVLSYPDGLLANYHASWGIPYSKLAFSIHAHFEKATLYLNWEATPGELWIKDAKGDRCLLKSEPIKQVALEWEAFLNSIETGIPALTSPEATMDSLEIIWQLYGRPNEQIRLTPFQLPHLTPSAV